MGNGDLSAYDQLPEQRITAGQLVAWNMARLRKAAGMRQDELGDRIGWDKKAVSAAERSWEKRPRQFDAGTVLAMAVALRVPVAAFLLPPDDDGVECRYVLAGPADLSMAEVVSYAISAPGEDDSPAMDYYRKRYAAADAYLSPERVHEVAGTFDDYTTEEHIAGRLAVIRENYDALRRMLLDYDGQQDGLIRKLEGMRDK